MTITVTSIDQGPFTATGLAQTVAYTFMTLTDEEISVFYVVDNERLPLSESDFSVERNKNVDGSATEGGSVEILAGSAPAGSLIYVRANPKADRDLVWSDTGSRLKNLNEEQDRITLRQLIFYDVMARAVVVDPGQPVPSPKDVVDAAAAVENKADRSEVIFRRSIGGYERSLRDRGLDVVLLSDFGARGGNVTADTDAFGDAIASFGPTGGRVLIPAYQDGPYVIDPVAITDMIDGTVPVMLEAQGESAGFRASRALTAGEALFDLKSSLLSIKNFFIDDPLGRRDDGYAVRTSQTVVSELPITIDGLFGVGLRNLVAVESAYGVRVRNVVGLNIDNMVQILSGGVDCHFEKILANGFGTGILIDSDASSGVPHAEGVMISQCAFIGMKPGYTGDHYGVRIKDILWMKMDRVEALQMGPGGVGLDMDGTVHALSYIDDRGSYWEGGDGGSAIRSRGSNSNFKTQSTLGTGQITNIVKPLDIEGANRFDIEVKANAATGAVHISGSNGIIRAGTDLSSSTGFTGSANDVLWDCLENRLPPGMAKESTSQYPRAAPLTYTPAVASTLGAITTLGARTGQYVRNGSRARGSVDCSITTNGGSAAGKITISLPYTSSAGGAVSVLGLEGGATDKALVGVIPPSSNQMTISFVDGTYPGANNARFIVSWEMEIA